MATRLFLISLFVTALSCRGTKKDADISGGKEASTSIAGRDAVENALLKLGIDGRVLRFDLNEAAWKQGRVRIRQVHLLSDMMLLEGTGDRPRIYALDRSGLKFRWMSQLAEQTHFQVSENAEAALLLSRHYLHALEKQDGLSAMQFVGGELDGIRRPPLKLRFTPTGPAAAQSDTVYIPSLGSYDSNKSVESFSLINGARGWGYRTSSDIFTKLIVGGSSGDPKFYFVTRTGKLTCLDAVNYGYAPAGARWEQLLGAGVDHDMFLTADTKGSVGALYVVDAEGVVYAIDRITGNRNWTNATGRRPIGAPQVFGNVCVVPMKSGLCAFHAGNVVYRLDVKSGSDTSMSWASSDNTPEEIGGVTFAVSDEVLHAVGSDEHKFRVNGGAAVTRSTLRSGDVVSIGRMSVTINDRGTAPVWIDADYDRIVGRVGDNLIAQKGDSLQLINVWTGQPAGEAVNFGAARIIPVNTGDANVFVLGGDAVVYALFSR